MPVANRILHLAGVAVFFLMSAGAVMAGQDQLAGSEWRPIEIAGEPLPEKSGIFIRFEGGGKIAANGGCNQMGGSYSSDTTNLRIGPLAATRKACAPDIMARETAFGNALQATRLFLRDRTKLTLKNAQGVTTMRLTQTDWD